MINVTYLLKFMLVILPFLPILPEFGRWIGSWLFGAMASLWRMVWWVSWRIIMIMILIIMLLRLRKIMRKNLKTAQVDPTQGKGANINSRNKGKHNELSRPKSKFKDMKSLLLAQAEAEKKRRVKEFEDTKRRYDDVLAKEEAQKKRLAKELEDTKRRYDDVLAKEEAQKKRLAKELERYRRQSYQEESRVQELTQALETAKKKEADMRKNLKKAQVDPTQGKGAMNINARNKGKHNELSRPKSEFKDMKSLLFAQAEAEKKRRVNEFERCHRYTERKPCSSYQGESRIKELTQALVTAKQKQAVSKEELKKMKAELAAAKSKEEELVKEIGTVNERARSTRGGRREQEIEALRSEIMATVKKNNTVTMDEVGGMNDVKEALLDAIILPKKSAQRPGLALLYGPSGTGKTHIVSAVAHLSDCTLFLIKASDIGSKWTGQSEKFITLLFEVAQKQNYSIIFIDELDCIFSNRERDRETSDHGRKVLTSFLTEINRIGDDINNVAVLAATNKPWDLDRAVQDRFDTKIYVPLPDLETRKSILKLQMKGRRNSLDDNNFQRLAQLTQGATARELGSLAKKACLGSMKSDTDTYVIVHGKYRPTSRCNHCPQYQEGSKAKCRRCGAIRISPYDVPDGSLECRSVLMDDFVKNLKSSYCSVTDEMRERYEGWNGS